MPHSTAHSPAEHLENTLPSVGLSVASIQGEMEWWGVWESIGTAPKSMPKLFLTLQSDLTVSERFSGSLYWSDCCKILSSVTKNWTASLTIVGRCYLNLALKVFSLKSYLYINSLITVGILHRYKTTRNWQFCHEFGDKGMRIQEAIFPLIFTK